jgi:D-threonate/D-erythronate kinase
VVKILSGSGLPERKKILDLVEKAVRQGTDIIVRSAPDKDSVKRSFEAGERFSLSRVQVAEMIADFLGNIAATAIREMNISGALLTGGDTAMKSANYLDSSGVILEDEVMHGIPYGRFADPGLKDRIIISKADGFGPEDAIFRILNFLKNG